MAAWLLLAGCVKRRGETSEPVETPPVETTNNGQCPELDRVLQLSPWLDVALAQILSDNGVDGADCPAGNAYCSFFRLNLAADGTTVGPNSTPPFDAAKLAAFKKYLADAGPQLRALMGRASVDKIPVFCTEDAKVAVDGQVPWSTVPGLDKTTGKDNPIYALRTAISSTTKITLIALGYVHEHEHHVKFPAATGDYMTDLAPVQGFVGRILIDTLANYIVYYSLKHSLFPTSLKPIDEDPVRTVTVTVTAPTPTPTPVGPPLVPNVVAGNADFGISVHPGGCATAMVTLTNTGNGTAAVGGSTLTAPWYYAGYVYPGGATCGASLAPGASCLVQVAFCPSTFGNYSGYIPVAQYDRLGVLTPVYSQERAVANAPIYNFASPVQGNWVQSPALTPPANYVYVGPTGWYLWEETSTCTTPITLCGIPTSNAAVIYPGSFVSPDPNCEVWGAGDSWGVIGYTCNGPVDGTMQVVNRWQNTSNTLLLNAYLAEPGSPGAGWTYVGPSFWASF